MLWLHLHPEFLIFNSWNVKGCPKKGQPDAMRRVGCRCSFEEWKGCSKPAGPAAGELHLPCSSHVSYMLLHQHTWPASSVSLLDPSKRGSRKGRSRRRREMRRARRQSLGRAATRGASPDPSCQGCRWSCESLPVQHSAT